MVSHPVLVGCVEQLIGSWPSWSTKTTIILIQTNKDGLITAWVALDDATVGNGCLFFAESTHLGPVYST